MNKIIKAFEQKIIQDINESQLPAGMVYYILKNLTDEIKNIYENDAARPIPQMEETEPVE